MDEEDEEEDAEAVNEEEGKTGKSGDEIFLSFAAEFIFYELIIKKEKKKYLQLG